MKSFDLSIRFDDVSTLIIDLPEDIFNRTSRVIINDMSSKKTAIFYEEDNNGSEKEN